MRNAASVNLLNQLLINSANQFVILSLKDTNLIGGEGNVLCLFLLSRNSCGNTLLSGHNAFKVVSIQDIASFRLIAINLNNPFIHFL